MKTYPSLSKINFLNPTTEMLVIQDIAHALSRITRFGGHTPWKRLYSVAEHSILVSQFLKSELRLYGLLHDAAEAYMMDLPSPLKILLPEYKEIERRLEAKIFERFVGEQPSVEKWSIVKKADVEAYDLERARMENPGGAYQPATMESNVVQFLGFFNKYGGIE